MSGETGVAACRRGTRMRCPLGMHAAHGTQLHPLPPHPPSLSPPTPFTSPHSLPSSFHLSSHPFPQSNHNSTTSPSPFPITSLFFSSPYSTIFSLSSYQPHPSPPHSSLNHTSLSLHFSFSFPFVCLMLHTTFHPSSFSTSPL